MKAFPVIGSSLVAALLFPVMAFGICTGTICITNYNVPEAKYLDVKTSLGGAQCQKGKVLIYSYNNKEQTTQTFSTSPSTASPACTQDMVWKIPSNYFKTCLSASAEQVQSATPLGSNVDSTTEIPLRYSANFTLNAELGSDLGGNQETCNVVSQTDGPLAFTGCKVIFGGTQVQCTWEKQ